MGYLGLDPEYSAVNPNTGLARSAHKIIGNRKLEMYEISGDHPKFLGFRDTGAMHGAQVERDGAAFEVRSLVVSSCRDNIIPYVAEAMRMSQFEVEQNAPEYRLSSAPVFTLEDVNGAPEDVTTFGCNPDFNAYTLQIQNPLADPDDLRRFTGGHIHVSYWPWAKNNKELQATLAILLDAFIGLPLVAMLGKPYAEGEAERREFYGRAGSFRYDDKLGKIEYRVPSGRILLTPFYLGWALGNIRVIDRAYGNRPIGGFSDGGSFAREPKHILNDLNSQFDLGEIRRIIDEHDVLAAEAMYPALFESLPNWVEQPDTLSNSNHGGGTAAYHPYAFKKMVDVFVEANHLDMTFRDDMQFNWGLYPNEYRPTHHKYWGIHTAMTGGIDDLIFPMREIAMNHVPEDYHETVPVFTHPTVGGKAKFIGSPAWLS